jgi:transcriptional regulator with XRE-family HTH domain
MSTFNQELEDSVQAQINILATTIKQKLALSEIKKKAVADKTGLSVNTINNCLRGQNVNIASLLKIAYVLGMNFSDLAAETSGTDMPVAQGSMRSVSIQKVHETMEETGSSKEQMEWRLGVDTDDKDTPEPSSEEEVVASILSVSDILNGTTE